MALPWSRKKHRPHWVEVPPGEQGTPEDEFVTYTYWEPSKALLQELHADARAAGRSALPDVTAPDPLNEPDGLTRLRGIVTDACHGRKAAAVEIFVRTREEIASVTAQLNQGLGSSGDATDSNAQRDRAALARLIPRLEVLEAQVERLEDALQARLGRLEGHFDYLASEFTQELLSEHPYARILTSRWDPAPLVLDPEIRVFGQDTARKQIAAAKALLYPNQGEVS